MRASLDRVGLDEGALIVAPGCLRGNHHGVFLHRHPRLVNSLQVLGSSHLVTTTPDAPGILTVVHFDNGFEARRLTSPKPLKAILPPRDVSAILPRVA